MCIYVTHSETTTKLDYVRFYICLPESSQEVRLDDRRGKCRINKQELAEIGEIVSRHVS